MRLPRTVTRLRRSMRSFTLNVNPPLLLLILYAVLVFLGAAALMLPIASNTGNVGWSEAIFTACSAVTVTGLIVVDTGSDYTLFGQIVVAILIQLGGLGLMTFAVLVLSALGQPVGITQQLILRDDLDRTSLRDLMRLTRTIFVVVAVCEAIGAALLATVFVPEFGWGHGIWTSIFHSISAFNNAGFSLYPDSVSQWSGNAVVNLVIPIMFITGGLGYAVVADIASGSGWHRYTLHTKLMLTGTAFLIVISVVGFAVLEWTNPGTLGQYETTGEKLWVSWFQGVTTRTAGFNTTDTGAMRDATSLMTISLMFIGGGTTSTAGGIKVTTAIVLLLATIAFFKRRTHLVAFGRSIGLEQVLKVMALTTISILFVMLGTFLIVATHDGDFIVLFFEVASAFGTVGLSMGATGELNGFGRALIVLTMFVGRVGPLTLGFFLATRRPPRVRYPEGQVYLG